MNTKQFQNAQNKNQVEGRKLSFDSFHSDMFIETEWGLCPFKNELNLWKKLVEVENILLTTRQVENTKHQTCRSIFIRKWMCMTATPVPAEIVFTSADFIVIKFISSLGPKNVNVSVYLRDWLRWYCISFLWSVLHYTRTKI